MLHFRALVFRAEDLKNIHGAALEHFREGRASVKEFDKFLIEQLAPAFPTGMKYGVRFRYSCLYSCPGLTEMPAVLKVHLGARASLPPEG